MSGTQTGRIPINAIAIAVADRSSVEADVVDGDVGDVLGGTGARPGESVSP